MNSLNYRNSVLHYFLILLFARESSFLKSKNFIIYHSNAVFLNKVLRLILIIKKPFIIVISYNRLIIKNNVIKINIFIDYKDFFIFI